MTLPIVAFKDNCTQYDFINEPSTSCSHCAVTPSSWKIQITGFNDEGCQFDNLNGTWILDLQEQECLWTNSAKPPDIYLYWNSAIGKWTLDLFPVNSASTSFTYTAEATGITCGDPIEFTFQYFANDNLVCSDPNIFPLSLTAIPLMDYTNQDGLINTGVDSDGLATDCNSSLEWFIKDGITNPEAIIVCPIAGSPEWGTCLPPLTDGAWISSSCNPYPGDVTIDYAIIMTSMPGDPNSFVIDVEVGHFGAVEVYLNDAFQGSLSGFSLGEPFRIGSCGGWSSGVNEIVFRVTTDVDSGANALRVQFLQWCQVDNAHCNECVDAGAPQQWTVDLSGFTGGVDGPANACQDRCDCSIFELGVITLCHRTDHPAYPDNNCVWASDIFYVTKANNQIVAFDVILVLSPSVLIDIRIYDYGDGFEGLDCGGFSPYVGSFYYTFNGTVSCCDELTLTANDEPNYLVCPPDSYGIFTTLCGVGGFPNSLVITPVGDCECLSAPVISSACTTCAVTPDKWSITLPDDGPCDCSLISGTHILDAMPAHPCYWTKTIYGTNADGRVGGIQITFFFNSSQWQLNIEPIEDANTTTQNVPATSAGLWDCGGIVYNHAFQFYADVNDCLSPVTFTDLIDYPDFCASSTLSIIATPIGGSTPCVTASSLSVKKLTKKGVNYQHYYEWSENDKTWHKLSESSPEPPDWLPPGQHDGQLYENLI